MIVLIRRTTILFISMILIVTYITLSVSRLKIKNTIALESKKIIVDAGHGGFDGGAVGRTGTIEKDLNLQIALKLKNKLEDNGYEVIMTREDDNPVSPYENKGVKIKKRDDMRTRVKIMNESKADIFISIHMNTFSEPKYYGAQVFYTKNNKASKILGELIQEELKKVSFKENDRQAKVAQDSVFILKEAKIPAVIVECGFISNPEEEKMLLDEEYQNNLAQGILEGVNKFFEQT